MTVKEKMKHREAVKRYRKIDDVMSYVWDNDIGLTDEEQLTFRLIARKMQDCYCQKIKELEGKPE